MADDAWYYSDNGQRRGPVGLDAIRALTDTGVVDSETLVWREGMADWEPAFRHIAGLVPPIPDRHVGPPTHGMRDGGRDYHERVGMGEAVRRFFGHYADFSGRSNRGEYWWSYLAAILISILLTILDGAVFGTEPDEIGLLSGIWALAILIPSIAIGIRRLHDTDRSGWWLLFPSVVVVAALVLIFAGLADGSQALELLGVIAIIGAVVASITLLVWFCQRGTSGPNRFG